MIFYQHKMPQEPFWLAQDAIRFRVVAPTSISDSFILLVLISFEANCPQRSTQLWRNAGKKKKKKKKSARGVVRSVAGGAARDKQVLLRFAQSSHWGREGGLCKRQERLFVCRKSRMYNFPCSLQAGALVPHRHLTSHVHPLLALSTQHLPPVVLPALSILFSSYSSFLFSSHPSVSDATLGFPSQVSSSPGGSGQRSAPRCWTPPTS